MRSTHQLRSSSVQARSPHGVSSGGRARLGLGALAAAAFLWAGAATWYILSHADLGPAAFIGATEMKFAYQDRIGSLSEKLEREITQNLVERTTFEARVGALMARQAEIEARQTWLRGIAERVSGADVTGSIKPGSNRAASTGRIEPSPPPRPAPLADELDFKLRDGAGAETDAPARPRDRLSLIEQSLQRIGSEETRLLVTLGQSTRIQVARLRSAIDATGIDVERAVPPARAGIGGPFEPLPAAAKGGHFDALSDEIDLGFAELIRLKHAARTLPLGVPLAGELDQTSTFGYRTDPFTRGPALHTGVDFRSEPGTPARATGAGTVLSAEWAGGYGLMVEIDHGGGLTTRYGHLSGFAVAPGERVEAGQIVGRTGSTGRSTGPHLHYETRIDGQPVNPTRFLGAGRLLAELN